jgi:hypothetical protein
MACFGLAQAAHEAFPRYAAGMRARLHLSFDT